MINHARIWTKCLLIVSALLVASDRSAAAGVTLTTGKVEGTPGKEVEVPIIIKGVKDVKGVSGMSIRLTFDPEVLTFKDVKDGPVLPAQSLTSKSADEKVHPGKIGLAFICGRKSPDKKDSAAVEQDGTVLRLIFFVNEKAMSGKESLLKLDNCRVLDNGQESLEISATLEDGVFTVGKGFNRTQDYPTLQMSAQQAIRISSRHE